VEKITKQKWDTVGAWLIRDLLMPDGLYLTVPIDSSEYGVIFEIDKELVKIGRFTNTYLDSRDFEDLGVELVVVSPAPEFDQ
jgi:hypothetical protein